MSTLGYIQIWEFWVGTEVCGSACGAVTFLVPYNGLLVPTTGSLNKFHAEGYLPPFVEQVTETV